MQYSVQKFRDLLTGEPIILEVRDSELRQFTTLREKFDKEGWSDSERENMFLCQWEASFFPVYKEVIKIFTENGYTDGLVTQMLKEFGADNHLVQRLLIDADFVNSVKSWFEGITCDGERTTTTMLIVHRAALEFIEKTDARAGAA